MKSTKFHVRIPRINKNFRKLSLLVLFIVTACSPAVIPAAPMEVLPTPGETSTLPHVEPTLAPSSTPEEGQVYPYYLPLVTKPDVAPQNINGVTMEIDWVYVDESRVAIKYTISGLDWPDGTTWDAMLMRIGGAALPNTAFSGAGGWSNRPAENGVITGGTDQLLLDGALNAEEHPNIQLSVDMPVEGPSTVGTFHFDLNVPVFDGFKIENIDQRVVGNGVSMTLHTLIVSPSRAEALICFQMPSAMDWGLTASTINLDDREYRFSGGGLLPGMDGKDFELPDPNRCNTIGFDIFYNEPINSITLTVPKLMASIPEVIDKERVDAANQRLAGTGIEFNYENIDHGGNIVILKRPEGATDTEIYPLIWDALAEQYEGPWIFRVPIER